jgi:signal transduction histidine kinase/DNA-binding response OmpR family regulator
MTTTPPLLSGKLRWFHWLIISLSLVLTLSAWYITKQQIEEKIQLTFSKQSSQALELIKERMSKYEDSLWAGVAVTKTMPNNITRQQWFTYYQNLDIDKRYPGINGLGIILQIKPSEKTSFLAEQKKSFRPFTIHPSHSKNEYWPITYIEPQAKNAAALGLDIAHEENRYKAAVKAKNTGLAQITGPIVLVQDSGKTAGFLFYAPFYQKNKVSSLLERQESFIGLIYAPFVVKNLMEGTLAQIKRRISIRISDNDEIIYDELTHENPYYDSEAPLTASYELNFYGRTWTFDIRSNLAGKEFLSSNQPRVILISGLLIDALLLFIFLILSRSNERSYLYAQEVTKDLACRNQQLEDEAIVREQLTVKANTANKAKSIFLSNMSHEIRTPLNGIVGMLSLCQKTELTDEQNMFLHNIELSSLHLSEVLNNILDYSKIESGRLSINDHNFSLQSIIDKVSSMFNSHINEKALDFQILVDDDVPFDLFGDELRISQILINLCSNAVKFTRQGRVYIQISCQALPTESTSSLVAPYQFSFSVTDSGIGINPKRLSTLFSAFTQADSTTTRDFGGSGLGLSISQKLCQLMSGNISVTSQENEGSVFTAKLQLQLNNQILIDDNPDKLVQAKSILLLDDNPLAQKTILACFPRFNINVSVAKSLEEAILLTQQQRFDVVLIDWSSQHYVADYFVKKHQSTAKVVVASSYENSDLSRKFDQLNVAAVFTKPFTLSKLIAIFNQPTNTIVEITSHAKKALTGLNILVAEDNLINQKIIELNLTDQGASVTIAGNGQLCVAQLTGAHHFDLVLMDIQMPVMDGIEATKYIRKQLNLTDLPIVALTANVLVDEVNNYLSSGFDAHLEKPMDLAKVIDTILQLV